MLTGQWHIHTNYTDGENSVFQLCKKAVELKIPLVAFTEHVNRRLSYDFNKFMSDIEKAREEFPDIIILSGAEMKVLPDCTLDIQEEIFRAVDYPIFAFHSFPKDPQSYLSCLKSVLKNARINTWAHPGSFLRTINSALEEKELSKILQIMRKRKVLLEINRKHDLPEKEWLETAIENEVEFVNGSDIHSLADLEHIAAQNANTTTTTSKNS